ncbi:hypothetical protein Tco_0568937 [Tanacetum coccineum]
MSNRKRSSRRNLRVSIRFIDHVMENLSKKQKENSTMVVFDKIRVSEIGENVDEHVELVGEGVNGSADVITKEAIENFNHNEHNTVHNYENNDLDEHSENDKCDVNCSKENNHVKDEGDEDQVVNNPDNVQKPVSYAKIVKNDEIPKDLSYIPTIRTATRNDVVVFDEMLVKKGSEI